jgi:cytochrome c oxidase subunit 3
MIDSDSQGGSPEQHQSQGHPAHLAHHFATPGQQYRSGKLAIWIFLATEILLFGGLFCAYAVYRAMHPEIFMYAHQYLNKTLGGINTVVLICSSLTMAWAVRSAQLSQKRRLVVLLCLTLCLASTFLGIKYVEYKEKWEHGLMWGKYYKPHGLEHSGGGPTGEAPPTTSSPAAVSATSTASQATTTGASMPATSRTSKAKEFEDRSAIAPAAQGPAGLAVNEYGEPLHQKAPENVQMFFAVYFLMTGLHGLHVIAGMAVITWVLRRARRGEFSSEYFTPVDLVGLYWHLVDMIWIYLFPLLYLIH